MIYYRLRPARFGLGLRAGMVFLVKALKDLIFGSRGGSNAGGNGSARDGAFPRGSAPRWSCNICLKAGKPFHVVGDPALPGKGGVRTLRTVGMCEECLVSPAGREFMVMSRHMAGKPYGELAGPEELEEVLERFRSDRGRE